MAFDYKKEYKDLYMPKCAPVQADVPAMGYFCVRGKGNPNTCEDYKAALEILYGLSFTVKMSKMSGDTPAGYFEYVVPPLEGFWWMEEDGDPADKDKYCWLSMIRQPEFVDGNVFAWAKERLFAKKPQLDLSKAEFRVIREGLCVQAMHLGSYDDEPATFARIDAYIRDNGLERAGRYHHEIYLGNPRKVAPEKLRTVLRVPVRRKEIL